MSDASTAAILVIKLGALGDFVQALAPFAAIRKHHAGQQIILLTTPPFGEFARASGYFEDITTDGRPGSMNIAGWFRLRQFLHKGGFGRVYDLQTSDRSSFYYRLFWPGPYPEWSGIAGGCSHPHANPNRDFMHTVERQTEQLAMAGIEEVPAPDLSWAVADVSGFGLSERYALLVPGGAAHRPGKRWPPERFGELAKILAGKSIQPVLVGTAEEEPIISAIRHLCPDAVSLAGHTGLADLAALGRGALVAAGNDTGPMHMIAAAGCPSVVLFSGASDPSLTAPRGPETSILQCGSLVDLPLDEVAAALSLR